MHDASHLGIGIGSQRLKQRAQGEPAGRGRGEHRAAPHVGIRVGNPPPDVGREPRGIPYQQPAERLVSGGAHARVFSIDRRQRLAQIVSRGTLRRHRFCGRCCRLLLQLLAKSGLAALSQGVVSFEVEDRAAQAGDELGKVDGFGVAVANSALPLDHPGKQRLAGCHQLVHASPQLRGCLFAGGDALPGRSDFAPQAHQLLRVVARLRLEEMPLEFGAQRLGLFQSPVQRGDFLTRAGDFVLEQAQAAGLTGFTGRSLGEPDAGLIGFGARLVERAAQLFEPTLEQQGPVRAPRAPPGRRASMRGRYACSQGKRTMRHYSEMREFAKPGRPGPPLTVSPPPAQLPSAARSVG